MNDSDDFRCFAMPWETLDTVAKCFPELEAKALRLIEYFLGYLPVPVIYMPHEAFIRTLIASYQNGTLRKDNLLDEVEFHAKRIRNDDMKKGGWVKYLVHDEADYKRYDMHLAIYKHIARDRLCELIGYEPSLDHSLEAELYLREFFQSDAFTSETPYCHIDHKAVTIVRYREAYLLQGEMTADDSDLMGLLYEAVKIKHEERISFI